MTDLDLTQYPADWSAYVGQDTARRQLKLALASAATRRAALDHVLLAAPPGAGKTALALLVAREATKRKGAQYRVVQPPLTWSQFFAISTELADRDVIVIDEAHKVVEGGKKNSEFLLSYLQDGGLMSARGFVQLPAITIVAATTEPERIPESVLSRFPIRPVLGAYSEPEAARIAALTARSVMEGLPMPSVANCQVIATASNANPRAIRRLLTTLRDLAVTGAVANTGRDGYEMATVLDFHDVSVDGLDRNARRYLHLLLNEFAGKAGARAITGRMGIGTADVETVLLDRGLITRTSTGREISPAGIRRTLDLEKGLAA